MFRSMALPFLLTPDQALLSLESQDVRRHLWTLDSGCKCPGPRKADGEPSKISWLMPRCRPRARWNNWTSATMVPRRTVKLTKSSRLASPLSSAFGLGRSRLYGSTLTAPQAFQMSAQTTASASITWPCSSGLCLSSFPLVADHFSIVTPSEAMTASNRYLLRKLWPRWYRTHKHAP